MEFKFGDKTVKINKRTLVRGVLTFTAGAGAYIIIRHAVKTNVPSESFNIVGKTIVTVGAFVMANAVADKVSESAGKFYDDCVDAYENVNKATQDVIDGLRNAKQQA